MRQLPRRVELWMLLRSLSVQGSWNYDTLIGTGFAYTVLPALRALHASDGEGLRAATERHAELFNSHPYLVTIAAGAVARLEAERFDPGLIVRFKSALRGSLGSIGDQLVWSAWRPASVLLGLVLLLAGAAWWVAVVSFLLAHNALHLALRVWGLRMGVRSGIDVGKALKRAPLQRLGAGAADVGAFLAGVAVVLLVAPAAADLPQVGTAVAGAAVGLWLGLRTRRVMVTLVSTVWAFGIILGLMG